MPWVDITWRRTESQLQFSLGQLNKMNNANGYGVESEDTDSQ